VNHDDPELDELLAPLRNGPVALSGAADAAARRMRLLPHVRQAVREVPTRLQRARRRTALLWSGTAMAAAALLGVGIAHHIAPVAELPVQLAAQATELRVDPLGHESAAWIDAAGSRRPIHASAALEGSGELVAAAGSWSRLSTPQGVRVELAPRTRLRVRAAARSLVGAQLNLVEGEVQCQVPKLGTRAQFAIETADARVIVHGTRFSVHVGTPDHPGTCVKVSEGLVEVQHDGLSTMLPRNTQWGCAPAPEQQIVSELARAVVVAPVVAAAALAEPVRTQIAKSVRASGGASTRALRANVRRAARTHRSASRASSEAVAVAETKPAASSGTAPALRGGASSPASDASPAAGSKPAASVKPTSDLPAQPARSAAGTLGEENRLLSAALTAERSGDRERARGLLEQLVAQNPSSPLAPDARTGLARLR
jgi:hypothetical protein